MTIERAHKLLDEYYARGEKWHYVNYPLPWALYQVWRIADREARTHGK
jgi:hypothetical protein